MCLYRLYNYVTSKYHKLHVLVDKSINILTIYSYVIHVLLHSLVPIHPCHTMYMYM